MGTLRLWATAAGIRRIDFQSGPDLVRAGEELSSEPPPPHVAHALDALRGYFESGRTGFDLPLDLHHVTPFQRRIYDRLLEIPYGHVVTYGDVARDLGLGTGAARAVGQAVGANPVVIVIPCHRVVGVEGRLSGFGGGLKRKATLLRHEGIEVDGATASSKVHPEVLRLPF